MKLKEGDLVWIDNPGTPYKDWNGASCVVENPNAGRNGEYVSVRLVIPNAECSTALFHPGDVKRETRIWLRRHLRKFLTMRADLLKSAQSICEKYGDTQ